MIRRLTSLFVLVALAVTPVAASSVTILLDASFSMSLPAGASTRLGVLAEELRAWMRTQPPATRYSLLIAEHGGTPARELPYPATRAQVSAALYDIVPWGSIDLGASIREAAQLAASIAAASGDPMTRLLVVSDGEDVSALTGAPWPAVAENVRVTALLLPERSPAAVHGQLGSLAARETVPAPTEPLAPSTVDIDTDRAGESTIAPDEPTPEARSHEGALSRAATQPSDAGQVSLLVRWARLSRWLFLAGTLLGLAGVWKASARHRRRVRAVLEHNERPPALQLEIRGPSGREERAIADYPATLGAGAGGSLHPDLAGTSPSIRIDCEDDRIVLSAPEKVRINGVGRTEHALREGNQIRLGSVRIVVREISRPKPLRPPRPRHRRYPLAPAAAAAVATGAFLIAALASPAAAPAAAEDASPSARAASTREPSARRRAEESRPAETLPPARATPRLTLPDMVAPGDPVPEIDLDYLAVHAHPDDESLDFGGLIARMSAAGLRGAVLLLTDGNSGLDQYPYRGTDPTYPAYDLADDALARVRVEEAREAIGWLGADLYVRYGLPNYPYESIEQELAPRELLDRWGGVDNLAQRLRSVIAALRPEVLLAPDGPAGPSGPIEHFEHEATGLLVNRVLESLGTDSSVRLVLRSVDPLQAEGYEELHALEPYEPAADGTAPRLRQVLALLSHRTQRDATVIGLETRMTLRFEYYRIERRTRDADDVAARLGLARVDLVRTRPYPIPERRNQ